jgi:hypothetical protein
MYYWPVRTPLDENVLVLFVRVSVGMIYAGTDRNLANTATDNCNGFGRNACRTVIVTMVVVAVVLRGSVFQGEGAYSTLLNFI